MKVISNAEFGGERPLFESHDLRLENVIIRAGESAIKECSNIEAVDCRFEGNYPFWHVHGFVIDRCFFGYIFCFVHEDYPFSYCVFSSYLITLLL